MFKKTIALIIISLLILPVFQVKADSYPKEETDWKVTFNGTRLTSNYDADVIAQALKGMQPGDTADLEFTLINNYSQAVNWWAGNEILKSFEDGSKATSGAYKYSLSYVDPSGNNTVLYSSDAIGGDDSTGLHVATETLDNLFLLGSIGPNESAKVLIHIELDGETQRNSYQDTLARLQINFAVEIPDKPRTFIIPKTGVFTRSGNDMVLIRNLCYVAAGISLLIQMILVIFLYRRRKERKA